MLNYEKLMKHNPTSYGKITNSVGQEIEFFEDPIEGQDETVICVCHALQLAARSTFYETDDMKAEHGEYEPSFIDGLFCIGDSQE